MLSELTIRGLEKLAQTWTLQVQTFKRVSKLLLKLQLSVWLNAWMNMACHMNIRMLEQYKLAKSNDEYIQWLQSVGIKLKAWHSNIFKRCSSVRCVS